MFHLIIFSPIVIRFRRSPWPLVLHLTPKSHKIPLYFILYIFRCSIKLIRNFSFLSIPFQNGTLLRHAGDRYLSVDEYCFDVYSFTVKKTPKFLVNPFVCGLENTPWYIEMEGFGKLAAEFIIEPG